MTRSGKTIETAGELLAHAHQMELEAQERYVWLAEQMQTHNNVELAVLFCELARVEGLHAADIEKQMLGMDVPHIRPPDYQWPDRESPEAVDMGDMDYLMTPHQALKLALKAERNAFDFFDRLLKATDDPDIIRFASEFAEEEQEHVELVLRELKKYPEGADAPEDMDPPVAQG